eukprot:10005789-Alexandrium_andersonii.AAC.1
MQHGKKRLPRANGNGRQASPLQRPADSEPGGRAPRRGGPGESRPSEELRGPHRPRQPPRAAR